jgi:cell division protein FtsQ
VSEVHLNRKKELTLYTLQGGVPIHFGSGDYADKLNRLEKVLPDLRSKLKSVEFLTLNYPKKVVVKMKEGRTERSHKS